MQKKKRIQRGICAPAFGKPHEGCGIFALRLFLNACVLTYLIVTNYQNILIGSLWAPYSFSKLACLNNCVKDEGKNVEFPLMENIFSEFLEKLKVSEYYRKSESFRLQREI